MEALLQDVSYTARSLRKSPGFALVVVLTLALGIGANAAIFSVIDAVLLRPLPYPNAERIVSISSTSPGGDMKVADAPSIGLWAERARSFEAFAAYGRAGANFSGAAAPERLSGARVTADFFRVLDARPELGRTFGPDEAAESAEQVVILGDAVWRRAFGADPGVLGRTVRLDGESVTVVGVMPAGFDFPVGAEYWRPLALPAADGPGFFYFAALARLHPGVPATAAQTELTELRRNAGDVLPASLHSPSVGVRVITLHERLHGELRPALLVLLAGVGCVLFIACANVANLHLARGTRRRREFAVRVALGASRGRIVRQLLIESLLLALAGAALGLLIPLYGLDLFVRLGPEALTQAPEIVVDRRVLTFSLVAALLTAVAFGLVPSLAASRAMPHDALRDGNSATGGRRARSRRLLVSAQLALALVLMTGAILFARSFAAFRSVDPGFHASGVLTAHVALPRAQYPGAETWSAFHRELLEQIRALPGVEAATISDVVPLSGFRMTLPFAPAGGAGDEHTIASAAVGAGYFATFGIPLLAGREFLDHDQPGTPPVAVLSESLARLAFPDRPAVGEVFEFGGETYMVVGVVGNARQLPDATAPLPIAYTSFTQAGASPFATLALRARSDPHLLVRSLERAVHTIDPEQPIYRIRMLEEELDRAIAPRRFQALLLGSFAALALGLAGSGLYALVAYLVSQRTRELGVRMALGAGQGRVLRLVLRDVMLLSAGGIAIGLVTAFGLARATASLLYGVSPYDPLTFAGAALGLAAVAALASWIPARRATRMDPMAALRAE